MLTYRLATTDDIDLLINLRIEFLNEISGNHEQETENELRRALEEYFDRGVVDGSYVCWLAFDHDVIAGVGAMAIWSKPGNYKCPNGKVGYVMNMYTPPAHRRQGICSELLRKLIATARERDITMLEMHATIDGEPVYRKQHFTEPKSPFLELSL